MGAKVEVGVGVKVEVGVGVRVDVDAKVTDDTVMGNWAGWILYEGFRTTLTGLIGFWVISDGFCSGRLMMVVVAVVAVGVDVVVESVSIAEKDIH
jgi:hypothetical protein